MLLFQISLLGPSYQKCTCGNFVLIYFKPGSIGYVSRIPQHPVSDSVQNPAFPPSLVSYIPVQCHLWQIVQNRHIFQSDTRYCDIIEGLQSTEWREIQICSGVPRGNQCGSWSLSPSVSFSASSSVITILPVVTHAEFRKIRKSWTFCHTLLANIVMAVYYLPLLPLEIDFDCTNQCMDVFNIWL